MGVNLNDILGNKQENILEDRTKKQMDKLLIAMIIVVVLIVILGIIMFIKIRIEEERKRAEKVTAELNAIAVQVREYYELHMQGDPNYQEFIGKPQEQESDSKRVQIKRDGQTIEYKYGWYYVTKSQMDDPKLLGSDPVYTASSKKGYAINYQAAIQSVSQEQDRNSNNFIVYLDGVKQPGKNNYYYEHVDIAAVAADETPAKTIYINTADDMAKLEDPKNWNGRFVLNRDIDMSGYKDWQPVGNSATKFTGSFDGKGYKITNFVIEKPNLENAGLFGYVGETGSINNLVMIDSSVVGGQNTGIVAAVFHGIITNSKISGYSTSGTADNAGGLFGTFYGTANGILCSVNVNGKNNVGGFAGNIQGGTITNVFVREKMNVKGDGRSVGGFAGFLSNSTRIIIDKCYAKANVYASEGRAGGFIGYVSARSENRNYTTTISHCYSLGEVVECPREGGGFIGEISANGAGLKLDASYAYTAIDRDCLENRGGFAGKVNENGTVEWHNVYWIKETLSTDSEGNQLAGVGNERNDKQYLDYLPTSFSISDLNGWSDGTGSWILSNSAKVKATLAGEPTSSDWSIFDK